MIEPYRAWAVQIATERGVDLRGSVHTLLKRFCTLPSIRCLSCTIEMELSYMRVRETKPSLVWEISPASGFSTLVLLHALLANEKEGHLGVLHSFDVLSNAAKHIRKEDTGGTIATHALQL